MINTVKNKFNYFPLSVNARDTRVLKFEKNILDLKLYLDIDKNFYNNSNFANEIFTISVVKLQINKNKQRVKQDFRNYTNLEKSIIRIKNPLYAALAESKFGENEIVINRISFSKSDISTKIEEETQDRYKFYIKFLNTNISLLEDSSTLNLKITNNKKNLVKIISIDLTDKLQQSNLIDSDVKNNIKLEVTKKTTNSIEVSVNNIDKNINFAEIYMKNKKGNFKLFDINLNSEAGISSVRRKAIITPDTDEIRVMYYNNKLGLRTSDYVYYKLPIKANLYKTSENYCNINVNQDYSDFNQYVVSLSIKNIDKSIKTIKVKKTLQYPKQNSNYFPNLIVLHPTTDRIDYIDKDGIKADKIYRYYFEGFDVKSNLKFHETIDINIDYLSKSVRVENDVSKLNLNENKLLNINVNSKTLNLDDVKSTLIFNKNFTTTSSAGLSIPTDIGDERLNIFYSDEEQNNIFINILEEIDENGNVINTKKLLKTDASNFELLNKNNKVNLKTVYTNKNFLDLNNNKFYHPNTRHGTLGIPYQYSKFLEIKEPLLNNGLSSVDTIKRENSLIKSNVPYGKIKNFNSYIHNDYYIFTWDFDGDIGSVDKFVIAIDNLIINCMPDVTSNNPKHSINIKREKIFSKSINISTVYVDNTILNTLKNIDN